MNKFEEKKYGISVCQKRALPSDGGGVIDARNLISRFRQKKDLYDYLFFHRQYYMPPRRKINKDFLKEVFSGKKCLISQDQIRPVNIPKYDELSVVNLIKDVMQNEGLAKFFPEQRGPSDLPERAYFFIIINTTEPQYIQALLKHSHNIRFENMDPDQNKDVIEVNEFWQRELQASSFFSSKYLTHHQCRKTIHLLKKCTKRERSGFKRKKLAVLGTFQEVKARSQKTDQASIAGQRSKVVPMKI